MRNFRIAVAVASSALVVSAVAVGGMAMAASLDQPDYDNVADKSTLPANINPDKEPVLDPPVVPTETKPSLDEGIAIAKKTVAESAADPWATVCLNKDGTLAGGMSVDAPPDAKPPTIAQKTESCATSFPGSHAPDKAYLAGLAAPSSHHGDK